MRTLEEKIYDEWKHSGISFLNVEKMRAMAKIAAATAMQDKATQHNITWSIVLFIVIACGLLITGLLFAL